jgi:hypothetical protein
MDLHPEKEIATKSFLIPLSGTKKSTRSIKQSIKSGAWQTNTMLKLMLLTGVPGWEFLLKELRYTVPYLIVFLVESQWYFLASKDSSIWKSTIEI